MSPPKAATSLNQRARDVTKAGVTRQEDRLHSGQVAVHQGHGQLVGEVGVAAQPLDDRLRARLSTDIDQQSPGECLYAHIGNGASAASSSFIRSSTSKVPALVRLCNTATTTSVIQRSGSGDHVDMGPLSTGS